MYLRDPFPSPILNFPCSSPDESLLWSSIGRLLLLPQTNSIGSDFTSSCILRFVVGGDGVRLSLSVNDEDRPLPFVAPLLFMLLLLLFVVKPFIYHFFFFWAAQMKQNKIPKKLHTRMSIIEIVIARRP